MRTQAWLAAVGLLVLAAGPARAATIQVPADGDDYSRLVAQAESGDPATDFAALRHAWLDSAQRKRLTPDSAAALRKGLNDALTANDLAAEATAAGAMLSANYIDLAAHKLLREACAVQKDNVCAAHEHFVEFGLLKSIVSSGDGKTCETALNVVSGNEETFVLLVSDLTLRGQTLVQGTRVCDRLQTTGADGKPRPLFFDVSAFRPPEAAQPPKQP